MRCLLYLIIMWLSFCSIEQVKAASVFTEPRDSLLAKSDSLFAQGVELYRQGAYQAAIPVFEESDRIDKAELDSTSNRRDYSAMWLASCYYQLGDSVKAQSLHDYYRFKPIDRRLTVKSDSLSEVGNMHFHNGEYTLALECFRACGEIEKDIVGTEHVWYGSTVRMIANCYCRLGNYAEAIRLGTEVLRIQKKVWGENHADYATTLNNLSLYNYYSGYYEEAIWLGTKAMDIRREVLGENHPDYAMSLSSLALYNFYLSNYAEAIRLGTEATLIQKKTLGEDNIDYATSLDNLALYNTALGNYTEAIRLCSEALLIRKKVLGENHPHYATSLSNLTGYNYNVGNYAESIRLETEATRISKEKLGENHPDYATSLNNLALYNSCLGNYAEAIRLCSEAMRIQKEVLGENHPAYASSLNSLATYNASLGNYTESIRLGTEAMRIRKEVLGENHPDYATSLNNLANYNATLGNYTESIRLGTEAMRIRKEVLGENHPDYATSLNNLANYNATLGNYTESIRLGTEAMRIRKEVLGENHPNYATSLSNLADYNASLGNYTESIRLGTEAMRIRKEVLGENHPDYATSLNNLANYNATLGNYTESIRLGTEAMRIRKEVLGENHPDYATSLVNLAGYNLDLGNYIEAIRLGTEAIHIQKKVLGNNHIAYTVSLNTLANSNFDLGNYAEAIRLGTEAMRIRKEVLGENHPAYALSLNNLASYNTSLGNYTESIRLGTEAMRIRKEVLGENHPDYALSLYNLAVCYSLLGNYAEALQLCTDALHIQKKILGENHPNYAIYLNELAVCYFYSNNKEEAVSLYRNISNLYTNLVLTTFADLTTTEQAMFWNKYNNYFNNILPQRAYTLADDSLYISAYNGVLLSKGLLLNAEMEMKKLLQESGDSAIMELYDAMRMNKMILNKQLEKPIKERFLDTDSLQRLINRQEQDLVQRSKVYGDYTRNLRIDWQDVQGKLGKEDMALEFLSFPMEGDSVMYAAIVVKPGMAYPEMIPLFKEKQLKQIPFYAYYSTPELYLLVWQPLEELLKGVKNVYFAPAGELYNIAIETLPDTDSTWVSDRFNLYRLSSTRQLALIQKTYDNNDARIYGGLKYDTDLTQLIKDNLQYEAKNETLARSFEDGFIADSLRLRSGAEELPGTRIEAENIKRSLDAAHVENELFTDTVGTEASFKAMSGQQIRALHIATHGFYWTKWETRRQEDWDFLMLGDNHNPKYTEDKSLTRSGLLMAGANNALMGIEIPENVDNGILTAKEIAGLDLRGMDMVVLSACQTGLGEITGEGVFGLQRGFKKAGAKSLLMSLWKVDDNATQMLMTQFYANLIAGMDKYNALRDAQRVVREYEVEKNVVVNKLSSAQKRKLEKQGKTWIAQTEVQKIRPYEHPKYWAAFILLDGIN